MKSIQLKVATALPQDVGYGRVRINKSNREKLSLSIGDTVLLSGRKNTACVVWKVHPSDVEKDIIRIDNLTMKNAGIRVNDNITVSKIKPKSARRVEFYPVVPGDNTKVSFGEGLNALLKKNLLKRPITKGDEITVPGITLAWNALPFRIGDTDPSGVVDITKKTEIKVFEISAPSILKEQFVNNYDKILNERLNLEKFNINTKEIKELLVSSNFAKEKDEYEDGLKYLEKAEKQLDNIRKTVKASISIIFYPEQLYLNEWRRIETVIFNDGRVDCKDIEINIKADLDVRGINLVPYLRVGERETLSFSIKPNKSGALSIDLECRFRKPYEKTYLSKHHNEYINVRERTPQKITIEPQVCEILGQSCQEQISPNENEYFVAHAFTKSEIDDLRNAIESALKKYNMKPYYADQEAKRGHILCKICKKIQSARLGIFEISPNEKGMVNPNVALELGLAYGLRKPCLLIAKKGSKIISDLHGLDRIEYESYANLTSELKKKLPKFLE